jgi:hypothetical protein
MVCDDTFAASARRSCVAHYGVGAKRFIELDLDRAWRRGETGAYWLLIRVKKAIERMEATGSLAKH